MTDKIELAAQYLADARRGGGNAPRMPENCRPTDEASALAVQTRVAELLGETVGGWKCSLPGAKGIFIAPILGSNVYRSPGPPCPIRPRGEWARIEPEIGFVLGRDLPARPVPYSRAEAQDAVAETRLMLELLGNRYAEPDAIPHLEMLADCLSNQGLLLGSPIAQTPPARCAIRLAAGGAAPRTIDGRHPDGDPFGTFLWAANFLAAGYGGMRAGQVVTTGSFAGVLEVPLDVPVEVVFEGLGAIAAQFRAV
ncbi:MAG: 2-keto-4-pentenoate hydratase [Bryobacteraceae bacterium]